MLTANARAYPDVSLDNSDLLPDDVRVVRAFALDTQRHLSIGGRYPTFLATPDRWRSWIWSGVRAGRKLMRDWRPHAVFSTFPIASAHEIACGLAEGGEIPWVADFRDPMGQDSYPADRRIRESYWNLERRVMQNCAAVTVTTEGTAAIYRDRYPHFAAARIRVLPNGFDEQTFAPLASPAPKGALGTSPVRFLHSGILYPKDRDPGPFFRAVAELSRERKIAPDTAQFCLRGAGFDEIYRPQLAALGIQDLVQLLPQVPYQTSHREMYQSDVLLVFQGASCNSQIPAKVYEYLYVGRPIAGFADPAGDTAKLLRELGNGLVAPLDDVVAIKAVILEALSAVRSGTAVVPARESVMRFSRAGVTERLAGLLDELIADSSPAR